MQNVQVPFLVREEIAALIEKRIEALERGYRQNIGLVGLPGAGKTYFLSALFHSLCARPGFIPIYINARGVDFEHLVDRWIGALFAGLFLSQGINAPAQFHSLLLAADPIIPKTTEKIRLFKKILRREKPVALLKELFSFANLLSEETGKKIIFMLDEFDQLENIFPGDPFGPLGKEIMIQKNTLYLVASSAPEKAREIFRDKLSMLFGNFEVVNLAPLGFVETVRFLESHFPGRSFSAAQQQFLIRLTDGIPAYLEMIADQIQTCLALNATSETSLLKDSGDKIPDACFLDAFYRELVNEKGRIAHLFERRVARCLDLSKDASSNVRVLLAIASGRHKITAIASASDRRIPEVKKILSRLAEKDLVLKQGSFYTLGDPLFQFWLREVYEKRKYLYTPDEISLHEEVMTALRREFHKAQAEGNLNAGLRVEALLKEFRNDILEVDQKKISCPQFSEITLKPVDGQRVTIIARNAKLRWHCALACERIQEEEQVAALVEELKKYRKKPQGKILIMLHGIEQNAKLMAQQAGIQLWDLRILNRLLDLYELPKIVILAEAEKEKDEQNLGAVAQSVYSAG